MKLRRTLALAAATAVITPAAVLAAPAAFAVTTDGTASAETTVSPSPGDSGSPETEPAPTASGSGSGSESGSAEDPAGETGEPAPAETPGTAESSAPALDETPGATPSDSASASASASASPSESEDPEEPAQCAKSDLGISVNGLPGRIARGSGWHKFKMNVYNSSKSAVKEIDYFAGASSDRKGDDLFRSKQVSLQALDPETGAWVELSEDGRAVGYVGQSDEIPAGYEVDIPLRINVRPTAPVGAGFTLGAGLYVGDKDCMGVSDVAYKFKIVKSGDSGSTPQTGGSAPVPAAKPADNPAGKVSGSLAETGSSSALPVFATAGGAAVVLGAGAMFIVRRRRNGDAGA
ncbi:LAETG motif-containing sortase-dependent surface protein [Streptomyces sp. NBC_00893]|uniref:LAETG motif-containing sortase-dependent surface protein n=1 Tax=Streptomyces sp. NBC_00893 TaxID=2975862 RepID=UPI002259E1B8|nr:LAETG motif-containing sortase-dependent surface protein [Streptomyces sp. NBC_00893]MCX4845871.1 LPXTG cell wall anchor domain-containing protein [Streptomyces sp. NBC_00893]